MRQRGVLGERTALVVAVIVCGISLAFGGVAGLLFPHPRLRPDLAILILGMAVVCGLVAWVLTRRRS